MHEFDYAMAFSRNLGITSETEQGRLRDARVAIAGMGGVGGDYLITLARAGIGNFRIADFDAFELANPLGSLGTLPLLLQVRDAQLVAPFHAAEAKGILRAPEGRCQRPGGEAGSGSP